MKESFASKFNSQNKRHEIFYEKEDSGAMGGRINKINSKYAEKKLLEIESQLASYDFIKKIFEDSQVEGEFKRWKLCEVIATIEDEEDEIEVPILGKMDSAVIGRVVEIWNEQQEKAN